MRRKFFNTHCSISSQAENVTLSLFTSMIYPSTRDTVLVVDTGIQIFIHVPPVDTYNVLLQFPIPRSLRGACNVSVIEYRTNVHVIGTSTTCLVPRCSPPADDSKARTPRAITLKLLIDLQSTRHIKDTFFSSSLIFLHGTFTLVVSCSFMATYRNIFFF